MSTNTTKKPNLLERKANPFTRSTNGARALSAMMLPFFLLRPPTGFGVLTTTGRRTGKARRRCVHVIRKGDKAYLVMLRPSRRAVEVGGFSAWTLNIRADPRVRLRIRGGTFAGRAREMDDQAQMEAMSHQYCDTVNPFDYMECLFHRKGLPTRSKIKELHRSWIENGVPIEIDLQSGGTPSH